ncbi:hypothetical protein RIR_jg30734.t1 [Rhizophagus irregularis DAOM 181602=DAOM 197198]|nr:hypothetical protein RIR_jg30734.t1 [Rhizophagus irregularis DAOM 181602=DAOM 197198]
MNKLSDFNIAFFLNQAHCHNLSIPISFKLCRWPYCDIYLSSRDLLNETRLHSNLALNDVIDVYSVLFFYNLRYKIEWVKCV